MTEYRSDGLFEISSQGLADRIFCRREIKRLYAYWDERRQGRAFAARRDIDPVDFSYALGSVSLIDVHFDPLVFHYRIAASTIVKQFNFEATGKTTADLPGSWIKEKLEVIYKRVMQDATPQGEVGNLTYAGAAWRHEGMVLPMSSDGRNLNMLLACRFVDRTDRSCPPTEDLTPIIAQL
jgi:hypothetical protein